MKKIEKSLVITALARDCAEALILNIPRIEELRTYFKSADIVIIENDSKDNTKEILKRWKNSSQGVTVISRDFGYETIPKKSITNPYPSTSVHRISKMVYYRNIYLNWIANNKKDYDIVVMIDIDIKLFDSKDILNSIVNAPKDWGAIFANGFTDSKIFNKSFYPLFYDMFAFYEKFPNEKPFLTYKKLFQTQKNMRSKLEKDRFMSIYSAFGGIGIYKYQAIENLIYETVSNEDKYMEAVCEHAPFNFNVAKRGYSLYIDRELKVYYGVTPMIGVLRNMLPLKLFKFLCLVIKFKRLKV